MPRPATLDWLFPLPRPHTGILLGNGVTGLMVWGDESLHVTISRAGFWDHRGGRLFGTKATFANVRDLLRAGDEQGVIDLFAAEKTGAAERPQQYGGGRLEIGFAAGIRPDEGRLDLDTGTLRVILSAPDGRTGEVRVSLGMTGEAAAVEFDEGALGPVTVRLRPAWDFIGEKLAALGIEPPQQRHSEGGGHFVQTLPEDDPLAIAWTRKGGLITLATALGPDAATEAPARAHAADPAGWAAGNREFWSRYWADVPTLSLPDAELEHAYWLGLYKQAGLTTPGAPAATLQGCWMEETRIPPWSNDYHFNINVQLVYSPALPTNRAAHLQPLWDLLRGWLPAMRAAGERFFGVPGALMLPHAVDDRCQVVGTFWTGTIDHACTAWVAAMAWDSYRYTLDETLLRDLGWPLLVGAFEGFYAMAEEVEEDGVRRWSLPVSVNPEYTSNARVQWGRDASFQLAAFHKVAAILPRAAAVLGEPIDPRWADVSDCLPPYVTRPLPDTPWHKERRRIELWRGQDLERSHRHHSHLAALWPFATIPPHDERHRRVVGESIAHWAHLGAGEWTAWCTVWASAICSRCGLADAALLWLKFWRYNFTNVGHGTLHNADFSGVTAWADDALHQPGFEKSPTFDRQEIVCMDSPMGAVTAILEMLVQCRDDGLHIVTRLPKWWQDLSFDGVRAEGAFFVGATIRRRRVVEVRVRAEAGGRLTLHHGIAGSWQLDGRPASGPTLETSLAAGQTLTLRASDA